MIIGIVIGSASTIVVITNFPLFTSEFFDPGNYIKLQDEQEIDEKEKIVENSLTTNNLRYELVDVKKSDFGINGEKPLEGGTFLITILEIENTGKTEAIIYGTNWFVKDSEERIFKPKTHNAISEDGEKRFSIAIPPGFKVVKEIGFEIPVGSQLSMSLYVADKPGDSEPLLFGQII